MRKRIRMAIGVSVVVVLALLGASVEVVRRAVRAPRGLPVVRTMDELRRTRPIALAGGGRVFVGASAAEVVAGEPLLLYALVEGEHEVAKKSPLGPLVFASS